MCVEDLLFLFRNIYRVVVPVVTTEPVRFVLLRALVWQASNTFVLRQHFCGIAETPAPCIDAGGHTCPDRDINTLVFGLYIFPATCTVAELPCPGLNVSCGILNQRHSIWAPLNHHMLQ